MRTLFNPAAYLKKVQKGTKHQFIEFTQDGESLHTHTTLTNLNNDGHHYSKHCKSPEQAQILCLEKIAQKLEDGFGFYVDGKRKDSRQVKNMIQTQLEKLDSGRVLFSSPKKNLIRNPISREEFRECCGSIDRKRKNSESGSSRKKRIDETNVVSLEEPRPDIEPLEMPSPMQEEYEMRFDQPSLDDTIQFAQDAHEATQEVSSSDEKERLVNLLNEIQQREEDLNDREIAFVQQKMNHDEELNRMKEELSLIMLEYRERIARDESLSQQLEQDKKSLEEKELELKELNLVNLERLELEKRRFKEMLKESFLKLLEN